MINRLKQFQNSGFYEKALLLLVSLSIFLIVIQSVDEINAQIGSIIEYSDKFITAIFIFDYLLRIFLANKKTSYMFSFLGIIDLISIIPSLLPTMIIDLRILRLIRAVRVLRIFKIKSSSTSLIALLNVFKRERDILITTFLSAALIILLAGITVYSVESTVQPDVFTNIPQSIWWAIATMTTVGYGDIYPITILGKIIATALIFVGIGIVAIPSSIISAGFLYEMQQRAGERSDL